MININRVLRLFTWYTVEVLAIATLTTISIFTGLALKKQNRKILEITEAESYNIKTLSIAEEYVRFNGEAEEMLNKTQYLLTKFERNLENCVCYTKQPKEHNQRTRERKKLKP